MMKNTILETKHLKKIYPSNGNAFQELDDIEMTIHESEFVGIMGPSGSSKTTLLHLLATIEPTSGKIGDRWH
jgi:ABC-type oligopeptide transport system ATPase subunit